MHLKTGVYVSDQTVVNLRPYIGLPGGPKSVEEAEQLALREARYAEHDHLGAREEDSKQRPNKEDCFCSYCRFYRGEAGIRLIMCSQDWDALPGSVRVEITESCAD